MRAWVTAVGLIAACGPEVAEEEPPCRELRQPDPWVCDQLEQCATCFSVDEQSGIGTCIGVVAELDPREVAAALAAAISAADRWKTECPARETYLDPNAEHVVAHAEQYMELWDIKEAVREDSPRIDVRVSSDCGGLDSLLRLDPADPAPTCCVGPDCTGADFRCEWPATEGAPTPCVAAE